MTNNLNILFIFFTLTGSMISISSTNWFSAWMGLELNMISFIPFIINSNNNYTSEASMKYFLIQASASAMLIFFCIKSSFLNFIFIFPLENFMNLFLIIPLFMKLGAAPFHIWFISVMQNLDWIKCFPLMTLQKLAPLFILNSLMNNSMMFLMFASISVLTGAIEALNQMSLNKLMAFSSISHLGWMLVATTFSKFILLNYLIFYSMISWFVIKFLIDKNIKYFNQIYFNKNYLTWSISILSMMGLPPLIGFLPKWMIIQMLMTNKMFILSLIFIMSALITLIFYIRMIYSSLMMTSSFYKWTKNTFFYNKLSLTDTFILLISIFGLLFFNFILT